MKDEEGLTLIAIGDMPLVSKETYASLIGFHLQSGSDLTVLTTEHPTPYGYGRVVRDEADEIVEIVEEKTVMKFKRTSRKSTLLSMLRITKNCLNIFTLLKTITRKKSII